VPMAARKVAKPTSCAPRTASACGFASTRHMARHTS
jgi:hypothetical protein